MPAAANCATMPLMGQDSRAHRPRPPLIQPGERVRVRVKRTRKRPFWRRPRYWLLGGIVVLVVIGAIEGVRYYDAYRALQDGKNEVLAARALVGTNLGHLDAAHLAQARGDLQAAEADFGAKSAVIQDGLLARIGRHLPWISGQVNGADALRAAGESGARLGDDLVQLVENVLPGSADPSTRSPFQRLVGLTVQHRSQIAETQQQATAFEQDLAAIPSGLIGPLESARQTLDSEGGKLISALGPGLAVLNAIPAAIGPGQHTYLVLLENPGEERPGGGFIGAGGVVTFSDGGLTGLHFYTDAQFDGVVPGLATPRPLDQYQFKGRQWDLADSNWWPDFPTSMAVVEKFYAAQFGSVPDGEISIDPVAIQYLIQILGPVHAPPFPQVVTADDTLLQLNEIINQARPGDPGKAFMPPFGQQLTREVLGAPTAKLPAIVSALQLAAVQKHVVLYFHDPTLEQLVTNAGFGGRLSTPLTDSVLVADANLATTKGDLFVQRHFALDATVLPNGNVDDQLQLTYTNPVLTSPVQLALVPGSGHAYRDYVQVMIPETSQFSKLTMSVNGAAAAQLPPEAIIYQDGYEDIGIWFVLPMGTTTQLTLSYSGPFADVTTNPESYALQWVKQVNALPWQVSVNVQLPGRGNRHWVATLDRDHTWSA